MWDKKVSLNKMKMIKKYLVLINKIKVIYLVNFKSRYKDLNIKHQIKDSFCSFLLYLSLFHYNKGSLIINSSAKNKSNDGKDCIIIILEWAVFLNYSHLVY